MSILDTLKTYMPALDTVANIADTIASVMPIGAEIAGAIKLGIKIERGLSHAEPMIEQTWRDMQSAAAGGVKVSDEEWAAWLTMINDRHAAYLAAAAKVEAQA